MFLRSAAAPVLVVGLLASGCVVQFAGHDPGDGAINQSNVNQQNNNSNQNTNQNENQNNNNAPTVCGDGITDPGEACDDGDTDDCTGSCNADCSARGNSCGDNVARCGETCDGTDLDGQDCVSAGGGVYLGGDLACASDCQSFTFTDCTVCAGHTECPAGQQCLPSGCTAVGNTCDDNPTVIAASGTFTGTLENLEDSYDAGNLGLGCAEADFNHSHGNDQVYAVPLAAGEYLTAWLLPQGWNGLLFLSLECPITSCVEVWHRANHSHTRERLDYIAPVDQTVYLVIDGNDGDGDYELEVTIGSPVVSASSAGDVFFTEVLLNPDGFLTDECEWFEIYNPSTTTALDLGGLTFLAEATQEQVDRTLVIGPGEYLVFARYTDVSQNCGLDRVSWKYGEDGLDLCDYSLLNPCDLQIRRNNQVIDTVTLTSSWPVDDGRTLYLCTNHLDALDNSNSSNWNLTPPTAAYRYVSGTYQNHGTPAAANPGPCN